MKRCFISYVIQEMQIKRMIRYHYTPFRTLTGPNADGDITIGIPIHCGGKFKNGTATLEDSLAVSYTINIPFPFKPEIVFFGVFT
jgi:hypothetical protein